MPVFVLHFCSCLVMIAVFSMSHPVLAQGNEDPWESLNRKVFAFNEFADRYFMKPVAKGYDAVTPKVVDDGISNMFSNLGEIITLTNDVLQFKWKRAGITSSRILINSTLGVFGLFDVASKLHLESNKEDFGQTFAVWGVPSGPYLMLPFWGPSTVTDAVGLVPAAYVHPLIGIDDTATRNTLIAVDLIDRRAGLLQAEKLIFGDRYTFIRDAYLQRRAYLINDGQVVDDFGEEDFEEFY